MVARWANDMGDGWRWEIETDEEVGGFAASIFQVDYEQSPRVEREWWGDVFPTFELARQSVDQLLMEIRRGRRRNGVTYGEFDDADG